MDDFLFDTWYGLPILIVILIVLCVAIMMPLYWYDCYVNADVMELNYEWRVWGGCFLETADGSYIHRDLYRGVEVIE